MNNELLLMSKNDIPFLEAQVNIHQPTINEISLISEESFFSGCQLLNFSKYKFNLEGRNDLEDKSDFEIFMSIMCSPEKTEYKNNTKMLLALLFPTHKIKFTPKELLLANDKGVSRIDNNNFEIFRDIIVSMFGLQDFDSTGGGYNPIDKRAAKIAEKLQKAKSRKGQGNEKPKVAILSRYVSVLAVGEHKDINELMQYTVFQLKDELKRFQKKMAFDMYLKARLAGAEDLDEVDNWMDEIHS